MTSKRATRYLRDEILHKIDTIPAMSGTATRLLKLLEDPEVGIARVVHLIEYDPGLTANVLRLANSAYFGTARSIGSVRDAVVRLGTNTVLQIAIASSVYSIMSKPVAGYDLPAGDLWRHCVMVAITAERLCTALDIPTPGVTFTAGLLHDIGKIVIGTFVDGDFDAINAAAQEPGVTFESAERKVLGMDHAEVGAALTERWDFPATLSSVARWHHRPEECQEDREVVDIVHVADALCILEGIGAGADGLRYQPSETVVSRLELTTKTIEYVLSQSLSALDEVQKLLGGHAVEDSTRRVKDAPRHDESPTRPEREV